MSATEEEIEREVRIALVLYGGVSLAIYENGVARTFHDLVRRNGIFEIVLGLLRARATVDTIAGTSAGGINGLILGACLESGADFAATAELWRGLGDFGSLLRKVGNGDATESLLDGEGYYHEKLVDAFKGLCTPRPNWTSPGEIDVFITGTDVGGHARRYADSLGAEISDKEHRVLFRLKHRPGRAWLGLDGAKDSSDDVDRQAEILSAVARITSSFPIAFPAFRTEQLRAGAQTDVIAALQAMSKVEEMGARSLVDGGVLDNKPFGPVLTAIFYRMPTMPVVRRLFYVEPDPEPFLERHETVSGRRIEASAGDESPVGIAAKSLSTIPAHEGISSDLDRLMEHNERIRWLRQVQNDLARHRAQNGSGSSTEAAGSPIEAVQYIHTRVEGLCRLLVLETDAAPSARDYPEDMGRRKLLEAVQAVLHRSMQAAPPSVLDKFDVAFHQRIAFQVLYALCDFLDADMSSSALSTAMQRCGRILKALEVVYTSMIVLRDGVVKQALKSEPDEDTVWSIVYAFSRLLAADAEHWKSLVAELQSELPADPRQYLRSETLSQVLAEARIAAREITFDRTMTSPDLSAATVLDLVMGALRKVALDCRHNGRSLDVSQWIDLDRALYPIEFTSGVHERDEIRFVRVSPADAQTGLSRRDARQKVAGDELAHFSSFLRRDWRSNDLLYGRLDGICQIIRSLLDGKNLLRAALRERAVVEKEKAANRLFTSGTLRALLPRASEAAFGAVIQSWAGLCDATSQHVEKLGLAAASFDEQEKAITTSEAWKAAAVQFRRALIFVGQEDVLEGDFEGVLADHYFQEIAYGRQQGLGGTAGGSSDAAIQGDAVALARRDVELTPNGKQQRFEAMGLGAQSITGTKGGVPNDVIGEYVTAVYLLMWGVLRRSLGDHGGLFDVARVNLLFRTPVAVLHYVFTQMRRDRTGAISVIFLSLGVAAGLAWAAYGVEDWSRLAIISAVVLFVCGIANALLSAPRWPRFAAMAVLALIAAAIFLGGGANKCVTAGVERSTWMEAPAKSPCDGFAPEVAPPMIHFEFASSQTDLIQSLGKPEANPKWAAAKRLVYADFLFIAAYTTLFIAFALMVIHSAATIQRALAYAAVAGIVATAVFDVWENVAMLLSLEPGAEPTQWLPAALKWTTFFASVLLLSVAILRRSVGFTVLAVLGIVAGSVGLGGLLVMRLDIVQVAFYVVLAVLALPVLLWLLLGSLTGMAARPAPSTGSAANRAVAEAPKARSVSENASRETAQPAR